MKRISLVLISLLAVSGLVGYVATTKVGTSVTSGEAQSQIGVVNGDEGRSVSTGGEDAFRAQASFPGAPTDATKALDGSAVADQALVEPATTSTIGTEFPTVSAIGPKIIKTADLSIEVKKDGFTNAFDSASLVAQKYNGFVVSSSTQGSKSKSGNLLIRVPMESFDLALNDLRDLGTVDSQSVNGQDVTSEFVDLNARLRTWQSQENVLLRLMNKANSINDTMQIQRELQQVQFQVENIKGQLRVLNDQTSLGTIQLDLHEPGVAVEPPVKAAAKPSLADAWNRAISGFLGVISFVIVGLGYVVPLAAIGGAGWLGYRKVRSRTAGSGAAA